jgi:hypothetical protein
MPIDRRINSPEHAAIARVRPRVIAACDRKKWISVQEIAEITRAV